MPGIGWNCVFLISTYGRLKGTGVEYFASLRLVRLRKKKKSSMLDSGKIISLELRPCEEELNALE